MACRERFRGGDCMPLGGEDGEDEGVSICMSGTSTVVILRGSRSASDAWNDPSHQYIACRVVG